MKINKSFKEGFHLGIFTAVILYWGYLLLSEGGWMYLGILLLATGLYNILKTEKLFKKDEEC